MLKRKQQFAVLIFSILLFAEAILPVTVFAQDYEDSPFGAHGYYNIISDISDVGIKFKRNTAQEGLVWELIEPNYDGVYDWSSFDDRLNTAESLGLNLMVTIKSYHSQDQSCHEGRYCIQEGKCRFNPCDWNKYETFLKAAIERYKDRIKYWQIENEPKEGGGYFSETPQGYGYLSSSSYNIIKNICNDCNVLLAGIWNNEGFEYYSDLFDYLKDNGLQNSFDIFDIHTGANHNTIEGVYNQITFLLSSYGYSEIPIWSTEFGPLTADPNNCDVPDDIGETLIRNFVAAIQTGFDKLFWRVSECPSWIIDKNGEKTATYYAYKTLISKLEGFSSLEKLDDGQYKFIVDGKKIYVLWCDSGSCSLPSEITGEVKVTDYLGDEKTMSLSQIILGKSPVFIEEISTISIEETGGITPNIFRLNQNYPNPFNPTTNISYQLPVNGDVALKIYNMLGQEVCTLINENKSAGNHSVVWNGKDNSGQQLSSGVYFYNLELDNNYSITKELLLLK